MISFQEYTRKVFAAFIDHPEWRKGQTYFNVLATWNPPAAERVRGSLVDPFYSDEIVPEFLEHTAKIWEEES